MHNESLDRLNEDIKYLGFGDNTLLNQQLEEQLAKGELEFNLYTDAFFEHFVRTEAKLHFFKHVNGNYYLDHYIATNQYEQDPTRNKERKFPVFQGVGATFKEAFNLLDGRAARIGQKNDDREKSRVWVQLDFEEKDAHLQYRLKYFRHYDLETVLVNYPIEELRAQATKETMVKSLERGNRVLVTLNTGKPEPKWIEANPAERSIRIYAPAPTKKRGSEERRRTAKRASGSGPDPAGEKATDDQELSEEPSTLPGK